MNEAIDEIKRLAEEFADARYEEAKDQDHGNGKADTEYCRAEVARTRAAMIEAIDRLAALHADQARDARIQALEDAAKVCDCRDMHDNSDESIEALRCAKAIRSLAQATQPVPGGKELP